MQGEGAFRKLQFLTESKSPNVTRSANADRTKPDMRPLLFNARTMLESLIVPPIGPL